MPLDVLAAVVVFLKSLVMTLLLNGFDGIVVLHEDPVISELAEAIVHVLRLDLLILFIKNAHDSSFT